MWPFKKRVPKPQTVPERRNTTIKRFLLFIFMYEGTNPHGGWNDFMQSYDTLDEAHGAWNRVIARHRGGHLRYQIIDISTGCIFPPKRRADGLPEFLTGINNYIPEFWWMQARAEHNWEPNVSPMRKQFFSDEV